MPKWKIHNKWAKIFGISEYVSNYVNEMIDFPKEFANKHPEYGEFLENLGISSDVIIRRFDGHDEGRRRKFTLSTQLEFLSRLSDEYVFAYFLHHVLDYLERCYLLNNPLDRIYKKLYDPRYDFHLKIVLNFVERHWDEIICDIKNQY